MSALDRMYGPPVDRAAAVIHPGVSGYDAPMHTARLAPSLTLLLLLAGCDDAVDETPPPDVAVEADGDPPPPDLGPPPPRKTAGEVCAPGQCVRGSCVNGVCSALCARDDDCQPATPLCIGRGGAGRCSAVCASAADCAPGLVCAVVGVDTGVCVAPGPGAAGDACATREDCASWFCAEGLCRAACDDDPCAEGERCLPLHTQSVCASVGDGPPEAPCAASADCASAVCRGGRCADVCPDGACDDDRVCLRYPAANLCERRCADSDDCGPSARCLAIGAQRLCVTRGPGAPGEPCAAAADCASGRCDLGRCSAPCPAEGCPAGTACVVDITGAACRPAGPAEPGARCDRGSVCRSGFCGAGVCTADCADGGCPEGARCVTFADGAFCFPACGDDDDCPSPAFCDARFEPGPICFWRGPAEAGAACADHRDCASGRCDGGRCLAACTAECPAGQRCVSVGAGRYCTAPPLPIEAACDAADGCAEGLACTAGRCLPDCAAGCPPTAVCHRSRCHPRCADDLDCRAGRVCARASGACIEPGPGAAGDPCDVGDDCAAGLCVDGVCPARCGEGCAGGRCVELGRDRLCLPTGPGATGETCEAQADCAAGLCLGRRCAGRCPDGVCPAGTACAERFGGRWCAGACDPGDPCGEGEVCDPEPGQVAGRCAPAPDTPTVGLPCEGDAECGADAAGCLDGADGRRCRAPCRLGAGDCAPDAACAPLASPLGPGPFPGGCVAPGPGAALDPCATAADCASGWCIEGYLDGRCGVPCAVDGDCGGGRCVDLARDPSAPFEVCAAGCEDDAGCAPPLRCRRAPGADGACY